MINWIDSKATSKHLSEYMLAKPVSYYSYSKEQIFDFIIQIDCGIIDFIKICMGSYTGMDNTNEQRGLGKYLSEVEVWALSLGCAVGWGAFVMPGTAFLPIAGPLGTVLGMLIGATIMLLIGVNYHYLMNQYPNEGGTMTYSIRVFGFDHGLLSAWFLILVYVAIMWANATAVILIVRNLIGDVLQWGFHYRVAGYDVYLGEVLLTIAVILTSGGICMINKRLAVILQTVMAFLLVGSVIVCACFVFGNAKGTLSGLWTFSASGQPPVSQVFNIVLLAPWAFAGFESISNSTQGFRFSPIKSIKIMTAALLTGALCYILLTLMAAGSYPSEFSSWQEYISNLDTQSGYASIPTFYALYQSMGKSGIVVLGIATTAGIVTGLIGCYIAASRLMYAMTENDILPAWFGKLNRENNPSNIILFLMLISVFVPFVGRAAIGWIVDINTIGALIAYAYTSAAAWRLAKNRGEKGIRLTGMIGTGVAMVLLLYYLIPNIWTVSSLSPESYLILIIWSVGGFLFFRRTFASDQKKRFGQSTAVWVVFLFMIFFVSMLWLRETTHNTTRRVLNDLKEYNEKELAEHGVSFSEEEAQQAASFLQKKMDEVSSSMASTSWVQMAVIVISLLIMFNIYNIMIRREKQMEVEKVHAEASNRAKSTFLSNMSHDIRTPMNAIIGYTMLAKKLEDMPEEGMKYLEKIESSGQHLLGLINDILDMSRIENDKMELEIDSADLKKIMDEMRDIFATQMEAKDISYYVYANDITDRFVLCDKARLDRVLLNLISNACKYTPAGGSVDVTLRQLSSDGEKGEYEISVSDTGMGMSPEFAATIFEAYSREKSAAGIQGTGLGMAITKNLVELMGGEIRVISEKGKGTEFVISLTFPISAETPQKEAAADEAGEADFSGMKLLVVDDNAVNREIAMMILKQYGFKTQMAQNGREALEILRSSEPGEFDGVLMDIQMPEMDGYEATEAIRCLEKKELADIPVIAMTANAFAEDVQAAKDAGMNAHIAKPFDLKQMLATLTEVLKG